MDIYKISVIKILFLCLLSMEGKSQNYSLGIDVMPMLKSNSKGTGIIFKKLREKDNLRARMSTSFGKAKTSAGEDQTNFNLGLAAGYERFKPFNNLILSVGSDVVYNHYSNKMKNLNSEGSAQSSANGFGLAPFAGLSYLFQENFSVGVESSSLIEIVKGNQENNIDPTDIESIDWTQFNIDWFNNFRLYLGYRF